MTCFHNVIKIRIMGGVEWSGTLFRWVVPLVEVEPHMHYCPGASALPMAFDFLPFTGGGSWKFIKLGKWEYIAV